MKQTTLLVLWMVLTILLTLSIIGIILLMANGNQQPSTWMYLGRTLIESITNKNDGNKEIL
jgi:uncharacterized membrane protein